MVSKARAAVGIAEAVEEPGVDGEAICPVHNVGVIRWLKNREHPGFGGGGFEHDTDLQGTSRYWCPHRLDGKCSAERQCRVAHIVVPFGLLV